MLLILLIVLVLLFFGGGVYTRGHATYGGYSDGGLGLGAILLIVLLVLLVTGYVHI